MRRLFPVFFMAAAGLLTLPATAAAQCEADGDIEFVCGPVSPEDLIQIPDSPWVIVASMVDDGYLSAADSRDSSTVRLFPTMTTPSRGQHDMARYGGCPGMTTEQFRAHGVSIRPGDGDTHTLYVVRHTEREAIEVFEVDAGGAVPSLTWVGCVVAPEGLGLNAVVPLPEGGFAATSPATGDIWEWQPGGDWTRAPGSEGIGPNGLEIAPDGQSYLVAGYAAESIIRLPRGPDAMPTDRIEVGFYIDNVHWAPDGTLIAAGHRAPERARVGECVRGVSCEGVTSHVARVDVEALTAETIFTYPSNDNLRLGTAAIQVGDELWVGSVGESIRIARAPLD